MVIMSKSSSGTRHFNVAIATSSSGSRRKLDSGMSSKENGVSESLKQNQFNGGELWYHHHQQQVESLFLLKDMQKKNYMSFLPPKFALCFRYDRDLADECLYLQ